MELQYEKLSFPFPKGATNVRVEKVISFVVEKRRDDGELDRRVVEYWSFGGRKLGEKEL